MNSTEKTEVRAPKFELYQSVTLFWNGEEHLTQIVRRWFDMDDGNSGYWWYRVTNDEQLHPEQAIEPHNE